MSKDKKELKKDVIYTLNGNPISIPIEITDNFRITKQSLCEDESKSVKRSLFSQTIKNVFR
jgi:hypothetical protein